MSPLIIVSQLKDSQFDRSYVGFFNAFFVTQIQTTGMPVTIANITINYL